MGNQQLNIYLCPNTKHRVNDQANDKRTMPVVGTQKSKAPHSHRTLGQAVG